MKYALANNGILSGRADNNVYMRNNRIRGMRMPANPQTTPQATQRANFGFLSGNWNSLTEAQRDTWRALEVPVTDNLGHVFGLTGKELYVALNRNLFNAGTALLTSAPLPSSPVAPTETILTCKLSGTHFEFTFLADPIPAGITWLVFATGSKSAGTARPGPSQYKLLAALPPLTASPSDLSAEYDAIFGTVTVGANVFMKVVAVKNSTGFTAPPFLANTVVIA